MSIKALSLGNLATVPTPYLAFGFMLHHFVACRSLTMHQKRQRRFALHVEELRGMGHRLEHDHELLRQLQRQRGALAWWQLDRIEHDLCEDALEILRQVEAGAPKNLSLIFPHRPAVRIVRGDPANARVHRERY